MAKKPKPKANSATSPALFESSGWHNEHDLEFDYYFDPFNDGLVSAGEAEYLHSIGYHSLANSKHLNAAQTFFKYANGFEESGSAEDMHYNLFLSAEQYWKCKNFRMAHEMAEKINPRELPIRQQIPILFAQLIDSDAGGNAPKQPDVGGNVPKQPNVSPRAANLFPIINESYKDSIPCPKAPSQLCPGDKFEFALPDGTPIAFSWCPPGTFAMGSDDANHNERPAHKVTITKGFFVSTTPITLRQWNSVMGSELTSHAESLMSKYATPGTDISLFISEERPA